ncbi:MAG: arsenite efflux transporter metallochaperone ArsD [Actinomycetota bacterium]|nr:arsenite efflux transporter metallochaperone ArsD [Actinomycetota bacterium]
MAKVEVFDPPMCCSTGVCGPSVDPALAAFAADLSWLADQGVVVERHTLSQEPQAFAERDLVRELLAERGDDALPAVLVDGELRSSGRYPSRQELSSWSLDAEPSGGLDAVSAELVAIGAAIGANCEPCFKYHYNEARRLGVGPETMAAAVRVAQTVKDTPARSMADLAAKLLGAEATVARPPVAGPSASTAAVPATGGGCCDGEAAGSEAPAAQTAPAATSGCCGGEVPEAEVTLVTTASGASDSSKSGCCG